MDLKRRLNDLRSRNKSRYGYLFRNFQDEIVKSSLKYIKNSGIHALYGLQNIDVCEAIENIGIFKENIRWEQIDSLFRSFVTLQKPVRGQAGKNIDMDRHVIDYMTELINNEKSQFPVVLRGEPKLGKSTLLTIIYINMIHCFIGNSFGYIPIYFNFDECFRSGIEYEDTEQLIKDSLNNGRQLSKKYNKPVCYIFDGMRQCADNEECIENYIVNHMNDYLVSEK